MKLESRSFFGVGTCSYSRGCVVVDGFWFPDFLSGNDSIAILISTIVDEPNIGAVISENEDRALVPRIPHEVRG